MEVLNSKNSDPIVNPSMVYPPASWMPYSYDPSEEQMNLLDYWKIIRKHLVFIFFFSFVCILAAFFYVQYNPKIYKIEATLTMPSSSGGGGLGALASQISSLPLVGNQLGSLGGASKGAQLVNIMNSRSFLEKIIHDFSLFKVFIGSSEKGQKIPNLETIFDTFKSLLKVEEDKKTTLINISLEMEDPILATAIVNKMLTELQITLNKKELTAARRNRVFIEGQLQKSKIELLELGKKLNQFYGSSRVSSISPQLDVNVGLSSEPSKTFEDLQSELQGLEGQLEENKKKIQESEKRAVVHNVPSQIYLQYMTLERELLGKVYLLLSQQYEMAKIEEAREDLRFQIIDPAYPPVKYEKPKKIIILIVTAIGSFFLAIFLAFFLEFIKNQKKKKVEA